MVTKTSKGWQIKAEDGHIFPKVYSSESVAQEQVDRMKRFRKQSSSSRTYKKTGA